MDVRAALKGQYHAALAMLKQAIEECPDDLWTADGHPVAFWHVTYHALFFTHLYLQPNRESFRPWENHREEYHLFNGPHVKPNRTLIPYTKPEMLAYWAFCDAMIDASVDGLDLDAPDCGFSWYKLPKLDHQINSIRHLQHHTALLAGRLRQARGTDVKWQKFE
jgi:hypothetical protein